MISIKVIGRPPTNERPSGVKWLVKFVQFVLILWSMTNIQKVILVETTKTGQGVYREIPPDKPNKFKELRIEKTLLFSWVSTSGISEIEIDLTSKYIHKKIIETKIMYTNVILLTSSSANAAYSNMF